MDQNRLQEKRRRRQVKRKAAQDRARRRVIAQAREDERTGEIVTKARVAMEEPGFFDRVRRMMPGGSPVTGHQLDAEPAQIEAAS